MPQIEGNMQEIVALNNVSSLNKVLHFTSYDLLFI